MKMKLNLLKKHGALKPGVYTFSGKLAEYLQRTGKAIPVQKEEKRQLETKEEKFQPETKEVTPISKLDVTKLSKEELEYIVDNDERKSAVKMAKTELNKR